MGVVRKGRPVGADPDGNEHGIRLHLQGHADCIALSGQNNCLGDPGWNDLDQWEFGCYADWLH
jgi:hypothetical protein